MRGSSPLLRREHFFGDSSTIHLFHSPCLLSLLLLLFNSAFVHSARFHSRRAIHTSTLVNSSDGTRQNVIIVQAQQPHHNFHKLNRTEEANAKRRLNGTGDAQGSSSDSSIEDEFEHSSDEEEDQGDSDVSEERNHEDLINSELSPVKLLEPEQQRPDDAVSIINSAFNNRKSFSCPKIKSDLLTGTSTANLSPEDIGIIAAMGDSLATGAGLWPRTDIEFRGAAFPIGGDATIDGLVTVPNILREFISSNTLYGVSHGMGQLDQLPDHQLNVAISGANSASMPAQATELVRRMKRLREVDLFNTWALIIVTIGTEETCKSCSGPNTQALIDALDILNRGIHKALVILLGPIHVSFQYEQQANLLRNRCPCSKGHLEENEMVELSNRWISAFDKVQTHMETTKRKTFNALALPMLTVTSRYPYSLFIPNKPLLNRRGHTYAAKWLWNRLIGGPKYNLSNAVLSQDAYFCPSLGCPYFRTTDNFNYCQIMTLDEARRRERELREEASGAGKSRFGSRVADLYFTTAVVVSISLVTVLVLGTVFYRRSKKGNKGRFDVVLPHGPPASYRKTTVKQPTAAGNGHGTEEEQLVESSNGSKAEDAGDTSAESNWEHP